jgi:hypothetical protein
VTIRALWACWGIEGVSVMTFDEILQESVRLLQRQGRISYRALKRRFALDDDYLEDLKAELIDAQQVAVDEDGKELVWTGKAETCFRQALDVARRQQAKSSELQAAMSLSRLWQRQDKRAEAHDLLAEIYGWFTEGFDTADLQEAKVLLDARR